MYNFNNETDVETAVNKLAAAANNGELYVIADEAFHYGSYLSNTNDRFSKFVTHLSNRVPSLHLWAAAVDRVRRVLGYSSSATPAPTDGPKVRTVQHGTWTPGSGAVTLPGHTKSLAENCEHCADDITHILVEELRVGQSGHDLQYRDTIILCDGPSDNLPVVSRLRARGVPVQVVTSRDDEAAIRNVALSTDNQVTVTDWRVVSGLERRLVVAMGHTEIDSVL
nr:hypothetical protein BaRGS_017462 [Batillaria attramentaria]